MKSPQALANINLKKAKNVSGPYLIMCLYIFMNLMKKPASVTGIKLVGLQGKFENHKGYGT
jgi:hypothetical protein